MLSFELSNFDAQGCEENGERRVDPNGSFNLARGVFTSTHTSKMEEVPPVKNPAESSRKKSQIIKNAGKQLKNFELFSVSKIF